MKDKSNDCKMIRVLSIIHHTEFSGPSNRNVKVAPFLKEKGVELSILIPDRPIASAFHMFKKSGMKIVTARFHRLRATKNIREQIEIFFNFIFDIGRIRKIIQDNNIDIVQINGFMNPHGAFAAMLTKKKVVWQLIDTRSPAPLMYIIMPILVLLSDAVMATGRKTAASYPFINFVRKKLFYFYPPVDINSFTFDMEIRGKARKILGLRPDDIVVGTVGTINPQKGHKYFIDAAICLLKKVPDTKFVILGRYLNTQEEYARSLHEYVEKNGLHLNDNIIFHEPEDNIAFLEQAFDFFWMTSVPKSEGISTAVEEAMSLCIPVIATNVGSMSEIVIHGETGYIVDPYDYESFAAYTNYLINTPEVKESISIKARKAALKKFTVEHCADRHYSCYLKILDMDHEKR